MDKKELMEYLKDACELEKQLFLLNQLKEKYEDTYELLQDELKRPLMTHERYDGTGPSFRSKFVTRERITSDEFYKNKDNHPYNKYEDYRDYLLNGTIVENMRDNWKSEEYDKLVRKWNAEFKRNEMLLTISGWIPLLIAIISCIIITPFSGIVFSIIISIIIGLITYVIQNFVDSHTKLKQPAYDAKRAYEKKHYANDLNSKDIWYQERIDIISKEYKEIILDNIIQTERLLEKVYAINFIHPKYRNMIAVEQIYEYLDTNRCNELEGPNGAYNLFESELRQNIIIIELDKIIKQLEQLNRTMYYVATAINESNKILSKVSSQLGQISSSLSVIERNTALIEYNTQCISFNTELMSRYR